jgi:hypothetical protein
METNKLKLERVNPLGEVIDKYEFNFEIHEPDTKVKDRFLLTIGNNQYCVSSEGEIKDIIGRSNNREFKLSNKEQKDIDEWKEHIKAVYGDYGSYEYRFVPTAIGTSVYVKSKLAGIEKEFTDLDSW